MNKISFMRQTEIFDPDKQSCEIVLLGAGSIGSFVALNLAKLGFSKIKVIDNDIVSGHNIPNQFYRTKDIDRFKVDALKEIINDFIGIEIETVNVRVTSENVRDIIGVPAMNTIFIVTFDNLESRKLIFDSLRYYNNYLIDARMGGETFDIITSHMLTDSDVKEHEKYFNITPTELRCGQRSVIYSILCVSSEVCNIVKKINTEQEFPRTFVRNMKRNFILTDKK